VQTIIEVLRNVMNNCLFLGTGAKIMQARMTNVGIVTNGYSEAMWKAVNSYLKALCPTNTPAKSNSDFQTVKDCHILVLIDSNSESKYQFSYL
jgi:hypothetical protein